MKRRKSVIFAGVVLLALATAAFLFARTGARTASSSTDDSSSMSAPARISVPAVSAPPGAVAAAVVPATEASLSSRGTKTVRITADRTMTSTLRAALSDLGARVIAPVGARAVLVEATPESCRKISSDPRFTAEDVLPAGKIQETLAEMCAAKKEATVPVSVVGLAPADRAALSSWVVSEGGSLRQGPDLPGVLYAEIPTGLVALLAERGDVRWIEYCPDYKLLNDCSVVETAANVDSVRSVHKLRGRGQTVAIYDSGFDTGDKDNCHSDFAGRVKQIVKEAYTKADYKGHGTHCAGTILGDGTRSDGRYKGMAPEAQLFAQAAGDTAGSSAIYLPGTAEHIFASCLAYDAYIHSDSWGGDTAGEYTTTCKALDEVMWNHAELLVVVACGNAGSGGMGTVGSPAAAKNALTVGNGYSTRDGSNPENLNISSSRGPTKDYRIKPEIVAPGTRIFSTRSSKCSKDPISGNAYYTEMTGTSMATPLVSGAAALVRQWLADRRGYTGLPSSALLKAILTGGGTAMTGSCGSEQIPAALPNNYIGWGRLNLEETLYPTNGRAVKFADWIPFHDGDSEIIDLTTTNAAPLDVQLCWIDHAADLSAARTLINDLDLIVSNKTTGAVWYGNGIAGGDHTNTTESVRLATGDAPAGDYAVIVRGYSVSYDSDVGGAAAVYIRGAFESETKPDPEYVRNVRAGVSYEFLDEALKEVQSGDTLEVLQPVELTKSVTLSVPCTIVATNADPLASLVTRTNGAAITLASGAELTLTNLVFVSSDDSTAVSASAGSRLILSGTVGVGMVAIEDAEGVLFRAPLAFAGDRISVNAPNGFAIGAAFGHWTGEYLSASNAASHVINLLNEELGGIAEKMTGRLVWGVVPCDPADAKCVVEGDGIPATYCRTFSQALQVALQQDSTLTVKKSASMTLSATLTHNLTLAGDGGSLAFSSDAPTAGFVIPQGTAMTVSNLVVSGAGVKLKDCAFKVTGGELTLESGATLQGLSNAYQYQGKPWGGAIVVTAGTVTMNTGSGIANCVAHSAAAGGGAIYLGTKTATANLFGGMISGCSATKGGAVYAWGNSTTGAWVNIKGNFTAKGNTNPDGSRPSNVFLAHNAILTVPDHLQPAGSKRTIGLTFGNRDGQLDKNANGNRFTVRHDGGLPTAGGKSGADTARHFFSDSNADLQGEYVVDSGCYFFQWGLATAEPPTAPFPGANVWIEQSAGKNYYYRDLNEALADLSWEAPMYVFNILGDILLTNDVEISKNVVLQRDASLDSNPPIYRKNNAMYKILPGGSLAVANVALYGITAEEYSSGYSQSTKGLIWADGGSLTLGSGAFVGYVWGRASRAANAITVSGGGTLTMESGSSIAYTQNSYVNKSDATGTGGAILLDGATAYLRGGTIEQCKAFRGGALYVANGSTAYVSGDFTARNNFDLTNGVDCVVVSKNSDLILAGELTGWVGVNEGLACDTNWFGTASKDWAWDVDTLTNSAAHFIHDKRDVAGAAVTNATGEAVLVWSDWISRAGKYVSPDGDVYRICLAPGQSVVVPQGFSVEPKTSADGRTVLSLEGGVEGCWYTVYSTTDLAQPFAAETSIQLKPGETFEYEIKPSDAARFYKIIAEEGIK